VIGRDTAALGPPAIDVLVKFSLPSRQLKPLLASEDKCLYTLVVRFEWDPQKAAANLRTHGISFAEAATVLEDAFALTREDPGTVEEQRFVTLGLSDQANPLVFVYAYRGPDNVRLISAWRASKRQRELYEKGRG
jgi:uncharacterized DUF497 family protein